MPILPYNSVAPLPGAEPHFYRVQESGFTAYFAQGSPPEE
jgi:hypothetical protein